MQPHRLLHPTLALAALLPLAGGRLATTHGPAGPTLVFRSDRGGGPAGLYAVPLAGEPVRQLVPDDRYVIDVAVAPDGARLAYVCDPDDDESFQLRVLDLESGEEHQVHDGIRLAPCWSPDGRRLALMQYGQKWRVRLTDPDVLVQRPEQDHIGGDGAPSWLPAGDRLVIQSNRTGTLELFVVDAATGEATQLTTTERAEVSPRVSPDGTWIAYRSGTDLGLVRIDGSEPRWLVLGDGRIGSFDWAPDSQALAVSWTRDDNTDIHVIPVAVGASSRRLTENRASDSAPAWSPDGRWIAFVSDRHGHEDVFVVRPDGSDLRRITDHPGRDRSPTWLPAAR